MKREVSPYLKISSYILLALFSIFFIFLDYNQSSSEDLFNIFFGLMILIPLLIFCGNKCSKWALKINKNPNIAYIIGLLFFPLGFLIYYIYYKNYRLRKSKYNLFSN